MIYIYHNKTTNQYLSFSNLKAITTHTGISYDSLIYNFNKKNLSEYIKDTITITKTKAISK